MATRQKSRSKRPRARQATERITLPIAILVRISNTKIREKEGREVVSDRLQIEACKQDLEHKNLVVGPVEIERDVSGAATRRPGLEKIIKGIVDGELGGVIVYSLDRFGRSLTGALEAYRQISDAGGRVFTVREQIDPTSPFGEMQMNLLLVLAQWEWDRYQMQWDSARARAIAEGIWTGGRAPWGYVRDPQTRKLVVVEELREVVVEAFQRRANGETADEICAWLESRKILSPTGKPGWTRGTIQSILSNPAYIGEAYADPHRNPKAHEAIVPLRLFNRVQAMKTTYKATGRSTAMPSLLSGIVRCDGCKRVMKPDSATGPGGARIKTYRCRGKSADGPCPSPTAIVQGALDEYVLRVTLEALEAKRDRRLVGKAKQRHASIAKLELAVERAENDLDMFLAQDMSDLIDGERWKAQVEIRNARLREALDELMVARASAQADPLSQTVDLRRMIREGDTLQQRHSIAALFDAVMVARNSTTGGHSDALSERVTFIAAGDMPADWPRRRRPADEDVVLWYSA